MSRSLVEPEELGVYTEEGMLGADAPRRKRVRRPQKPRTKPGNT